MRMLLLLTILAVSLGHVGAAEPAHRLLVADYSTQRIAIVTDGKIEWQHKVGNIHDLHLLPTGNVLFQTSWTQLVEIDPRTGKTVWSYDARGNGNEGKRVEVHAFQRLKDGTTMIAESGPARIIEVDRDGKLTHQIKLKVDRPSTHSDTRLARKLENGHYLVCHENDGTVREYDRDGKVVWEYEIPLFGGKPQPGHGPEGFGNRGFAAVRLPNGNTLITTGNGHSVLEVSKDREVVWSLKPADVPELRLGWITTLQVLPNGNVVFGNCHAGKDQPQVVEVNRAKKVVWTFKDHTNFGNATANSQILDGDGPTIR